MSRALLFAIGSVVFVANMAGAFILGFTQFMRYEDEPEQT